jgi:dephospho-CoA kinase
MKEDVSRLECFPKHARCVIGLTGPIAAGKSTVAGLLHERGADVIDADRVYHELISPRSPLWRAIVVRFGPEVVSESGEIDRTSLGRIVFDNPRSLADLERLTHPAVADEIRQRIARSDAPVVVVEAVKLFASGLADEMDAVWLVTANEETRIGRLLAERGMSRQDAISRVTATENLIPRQRRPDVTIDTSGTLMETRSAVDEAWRALCSNAVGTATA